MAKEKFLLLSLKEEKAKKVAQVINNPSCRKILDHLAEKESTETELAKILNLPLSTVHYNLKQLMDSDLVTVEEFHYSKKGKEINHYKLANKYVIIAPKSTFGIKEKLRSILPVIGLTVITAGLLQFFTSDLGTTASFSQSLAKSAQPVMEAAVQEAASDTLAAVPAVAPELTQRAVETVSQPLLTNIALWFIIGGLFALALFTLSEYIKNKKEK